MNLKKLLQMGLYNKDEINYSKFIYFTGAGMPQPDDEDAERENLTEKQKRQKYKEKLSNTDVVVPRNAINKMAESVLSENSRTKRKERKSKIKYPWQREKEVIETFTDEEQKALDNLAIFNIEPKDLNEELIESSYKQLADVYHPNVALQNPTSQTAARDRIEQMNEARLILYLRLGIDNPPNPYEPEIPTEPPPEDIESFTSEELQALITLGLNPMMSPEDLTEELIENSYKRLADLYHPYVVPNYPESQAAASTRIEQMKNARLTLFLRLGIDAPPDPYEPEAPTEPPPPGDDEEPPPEPEPETDEGPEGVEGFSREEVVALITLELDPGMDPDDLTESMVKTAFRTLLILNHPDR
ncbi:hypothetical protein ACFL3T_05035, partial [Patescibacteria group bacterium]